MKQLLTKVRNSKLVALCLAITLVCCMAITAYASSYSYSQLELRDADVTITILNEKFTGDNIRCSYSTSIDRSHVHVPGLPYVLKIQKQGFLGIWSTVAEKTCYWGSSASLAAYNVGDGRYRFTVKTPPNANYGIYINDFNASSWN